MDALEKKLNSFLSTAQTLLEQKILTWESLAEWVVILCALALGFLVRHFTLPHIEKYVDGAGFPWRIGTIIKNLSKLLSYIVVVLILSIAVEVTKFESIPLKSYWIDPITKLLLAWIFIRIIAQFIANNFFRNLVATSAWIIAALSILGFLDDAMIILDGLGFQIGEFRLSVLSIVQSIIAVLAFVYCAIFLSNIIERRLYKSKDLSVSARVLLIKTIKVIMISIAVLVGISSAGIDLSMLAVFGGALGLGIGFGLQKGVSNLFSGMLLLLDRSIKPGDVIELQQEGTFGWVEHMGARYTNIVTRDNKSYLVPNEDLITQQVINWSHGNTLVRLQVEFGVHYKSDPHEIIKIAIEAAQKPERVQSEPKPVCFFMEFGDSSLNFKLRFWIKDAQNGVTNIKGAVMLSLWDAFKENGIQIPYPHREVFIHNDKK